MLIDWQPGKKLIWGVTLLLDSSMLKLRLTFCSTRISKNLGQVSFFLLIGTKRHWTRCHLGQVGIGHVGLGQVDLGQNDM